MIKLENYVSKILYNDKQETHSILTYVDIDGIIDKEFIINYLNEIIKKNSILKNMIVEKNKILFLENIKELNINDYYDIKYVNEKYFDKFINVLLNEKFTTELKWKFLFCVDTTSKKSRFYFKISHSYADGYQIIKILTSPFEDSNITDQFKRKLGFFNTFYYYFIGTIILIFMNIKFFIVIVFNFTKKTNDSLNDNVIDYIIFKKLKLNKIKKFTKKHNITINDFFYSLMIKADILYRKKEKNLLTISPINISGTTQLNNMCPIFNSINNSQDSLNLFKNVNTTFNYLKYSLFIPILYFIINSITQYINLDVLSKGYNSVLNNCDYVYSNIIGPKKECFGKNVNISNIHFLTTAKNKEINFNIISFDNNVNITCSYKRGIINNKKFKKCINNAYNMLINT